MEKIDWKPIEEPEVKWIGVDFDNTLAFNSGYPDFIPQEPLPGAVEACRLWAEKGYKITVYTARHWSDYHNIEAWCDAWGIPARRIICGKPLFFAIKDDKNIGDPSWEETIEYIKSLPNK